MSFLGLDFNLKNVALEFLLPGHGATLMTKSFFKAPTPVETLSQENIDSMAAEIMAANGQTIKSSANVATTSNNFYYMVVGSVVIAVILLVVLAKKDKI